VRSLDVYVNSRVIVSLPSSSHYFTLRHTRLLPLCCAYWNASSSRAIDDVELDGEGAEACSVAAVEGFESRVLLLEENIPWMDFLVSNRFISASTKLRTNCNRAVWSSHSNTFCIVSVDSNTSGWSSTLIRFCNSITSCCNSTDKS
jgi:hypothetical protein